MKKLLLLLLILFLIPFANAQDIKLNGTISAENNQIKNVANPTDAQDVATKNYVDGVGIQGPQGSSAYEIWLNLGNTGTEQDFIDSLTGPAGPAGPPGPPGPAGSTSNDNFYETFSFSSGGQTFDGSDLQTLGTLQISEAGFVGVYITLSVSIERFTAGNEVALQIWNGSNQIEIYSVNGVGLSVYDANAAVSDKQLKIGHFYVENNTTLTIKGHYNVWGYNNYQGQGGNSGSFDVALYR